MVSSLLGTVIRRCFPHSFYHIPHTETFCQRHGEAYDYPVSARWSARINRVDYGHEWSDRKQYQSQSHKVVYPFHFCYGIALLYAVVRTQIINQREETDTGA